MKHYLFLFLFVLVCTCRSRETSGRADPALLRELDSLLQQHEYFRLKAILTKDSTRVPLPERAIYQAHIANAFNRIGESNGIIRRLLSDKELTLQDSVTAKLLFLQRDNFIKMYAYAKAAETGDSILKHFAASVDDAKVKHIRNFNILFHALAEVPPQNVQLQRDEVIPWKRDKIGLITVPVRVGRQQHPFVFDTRASISTITQSFAEKLNLRILDAAYEESSGITGNTFKTHPAIADSLYIGDLLMQHVIFQVVPDEILAFPSANYHIDGIIGFPVITQWKEVHLDQAGTITIPLQRTSRPFQNLAFDESTTVIALKTDVDTLSFHFDSGANFSLLYFNFLDRYRNDVMKKARKEITEVGGAGGSKRSESYLYPSFGVYAGGERVELKDLQVLMAPAYPGQKYFGNIGQDVISNFRETILNFEDMYLDFAGFQSPPAK